MAHDHAVVVGGTKGLGRVVASRFLARGFRVTVISRSAPDETASPNLSHVAVDLETLTNADAIVADIVAAGGPPRYIVFSQRFRGAGDPWQGELQVELTATRLMIEALADKFCRDGDRAVVAVSSVYAEFVGGSQPAGYHVAKAGLSQLVRYYAWQLGRKGIRVNAIMPLTYLKPESRDFYTANEPLMDAYRRFVPLGRIGEADDSANAIEFLCSPKASFINGQRLFIDGGVSIVWQEELARTLLEP